MNQRKVTRHMRIESLENRKLLTVTTDGLCFFNCGPIDKPDPAEVRPIGDSNQDGVFDSSDLIQVFQAGEYEDGILGNSTLEEGDWNGDGDFNTTDLVFAFQSGGYTI